MRAIRSSSISAEQFFHFGKRGRRVEDFVDPFAHNSNDRRIDRRGDERSQTDAVKGRIADGRPVERFNVAKQREGEGDRDDEQSDIERPFDLVDVELKTGRQLRHEQFVHLKGQISTKKTGNAERGEDVSDDQHDPTEPYGVKGDAAEDKQEQIERIAIDDGNDKGKQIPPMKAANDKAEQNEQEPLHDILRHADGKTAPQRGDRLIDDESGRRNHGYAEIRFRANSDA